MRERALGVESGVCVQRQGTVRRYVGGRSDRSNSSKARQETHGASLCSRTRVPARYAPVSVSLEIRDLAKEARQREAEHPTTSEAAGQ